MVIDQKTNYAPPVVLKLFRLKTQSDEAVCEKPNTIWLDLVFMGNYFAVHALVVSVEEITFVSSDQRLPHSSPSPLPLVSSPPSPVKEQQKVLVFGTATNPGQRFRDFASVEERSLQISFRRRCASLFGTESFKNMLLLRCLPVF